MNNSDPYAGLEPAGLWRHFAALNDIPRPPGHEAAAREYVRRVAEACGAEFLADARGNALVRVPARPGVASGEPIAVQAHLDMVCDSAPGVEHDFERDPVVAQRDGDKISARDSTLGADNGIGVAAALAVMTEPGLWCGPLELLFTVEEETGLHGALAFDASLLRARSLVNLDSEDDTALTVGCAGGADVKIRLALEQERLDAGWSCAELSVSGLTGGHSGVQIHEHRANAIKLLVAVIDRLVDGDVDLRLVSLTGGTAHNAIRSLARRASRSRTTRWSRRSSSWQASLQLEQEWGTDEPGMSIKFHRRDSSLEEAAGERASARLLSLLRQLPHGVLAMSRDFPGTVATSINLAIVSAEGERVEVQASVRSLSVEELNRVVSRVKALAAESEASVEVASGYPSWEPRKDSPLSPRPLSPTSGFMAASPRSRSSTAAWSAVCSSPRSRISTRCPSVRGSERRIRRERVYASTVAGTWRTGDAARGTRRRRAAGRGGA